MNSSPGGIRAAGHIRCQVTQPKCWGHFEHHEKGRSASPPFVLEHCESIGITLETETGQIIPIESDETINVLHICTQKSCAKETIISRAERN